MFAIFLFLLMAAGFIIGGGVFASLPLIFRIFLGTPLAIAAVMLARWYIPRI
jgi:hypothetical protein